MRPQNRILASCCLVAATLASAACTGEEAVVCQGAGCTGPGQASAVDVQADAEVTIYAGTVAEVSVRLEGGASGATAKATLTAEDLPENVTAEPLSFGGQATGKLRITALASARHGSRKIRLKLTGADDLVSGDKSIVLFVRDQPGTLDNSFGQSGRVEIPGGVGGTSLAGIAVGPGGIVAGGSSEKNFVASRVTADGAIDVTWGTQGTAVANLRAEDGSDEIAEALALGPGGSAVLAGYGIPAIPGNEYQLARFDAKGAVDRSFDDTGFFATKYAGGAVSPDKIVELAAKDVAVQTIDGKVVFAGFASENKLYPDLTKHAFVARLTQGGKLDNAFGGGDGWIDRIAVSTASETCNAVAIAPAPGGDKIVCAGSTQPADGTGQKTFFVWRSNADGSEDKLFGFNGIAKIAYAPTSVTGEAQAVHALGDKTIATGTSGGKAVVVRLDAKGDTDASFAGGAAVALDTLGLLLDGTIRSAVDKDGAVAVVTTTGSGNFDITIGRVLPTGALDTKFGDNGRATVRLPSQGAIGRARIAVQPDGRIVVGTNLAGGGIVLFRLWGS